MSKANADQKIPVPIIPPLQSTVNAPENAVSPELQSIISEIMPSSDPLDDPNFNVIDYINKLFPNEQALASVDTVVSKMKNRIARTDDEILKAVREQATAGSRGKENLEESKRAIQDMFSKINDIKAKAETSEKMVTEICRDIKSLDYAKKNLTNTITALKRCHMLITAVEQLRVMIGRKQYKDAGHLLEAVNMFDQYFADYRHIAKIDETHRTVVEIRSTLRKQIYDEFSRFLDNPATYPTQNLADICVVVDGLGKDSRKEFMAWFCTKELQDYNRHFKPGEEASTLDNTGRRFSWLKRTLRKFDEQYSKIFPSSWRMAELICEEFCFTTRQHLIDVLEETKNSLDVETLIGALKKTIDIENELSERFSSQSLSEGEHPEPKQDLEEEEEEVPQELLNSFSAEAVKEKYRRFQRQQEKAKKRQTVEVATKPRELQKFKGMVSSAFDLYMDLYIKKEDVSMKQMLEKAMASETWVVDEDDRLKLLTSSTTLMDFFKDSLQILSSFTKDQALFDLHNLFKKYLHQYASILLDKIGNEPKTTEKDEKAFALIVNTAEYCANNTVGMTQNFKQVIKPRFVERIDFSLAQSEFEAVIARAIGGMVQGLNGKLEIAFNQMTKMPWGSWETVGDKSEYVTQINTFIMQTVPLYKNWIVNPSHFSFFCDSFVLSFAPLFIQHIYKCKKLSEAGAQQLLIDFKESKDILSKMPSLAGATVSSRYTRTVQKEMGKVEQLFKVIIAPQVALVDTYKALIVDGNDADFQRILDLRGIGRSEQKALMESYTNKGGIIASKSPTNILPNMFTKVFSKSEANLKESKDKEGKDGI